jgi:glycine/D-amino acid oxidase-like deaminating enzyme/nitrite reductase/ring-hydroxylating ferredoxin subunit
MKSTVSLWNVTPHPRYPTIDGDLAVDVAIVGAGITGLTAALSLAEAGKRVAVLEARTIGSGVTGGTTAHLTEAIDTRYYEIESAFGNEGSRLAAESSRAAIERIASITEAHSIPCDFVRLPGFLYSEDEGGLHELDKEHEAARRAGLTVGRVDHVPLPFSVRGGLRFENQAQLDAGAYLDGLARAASGAGAQIFEHARAIAVDDGEPCVVHLESGAEIKARAVLFCTHAAVHRYFLQTKVSPMRSYVLAYRAGVESSPGLFWDTADPYHYIRHAIVGGAPYLIVGGEDHRTGSETDTEKHYDALAKYVHERWGLAGPALRWSAQVHEPVDGLPYIGKRPTGAHVYFATGFSGNGMTFGTVAAMVLSDTVLGRPSPWADLYSASRIKPVASARDFVKETVHDAVHFVSDWVRGAEVDSVDQVARGEGKIVRVAGRRLAVYRDDHGALSAVSPVCTHLGCHVHFNQAERSWDCACHGSRFDTDGAVLHGPAARALAKRDLGDSEQMRPVLTEEHERASGEILIDPSLAKT